MNHYNPRLNRPITKAELEYVVSHLKMMVETCFDWDSTLVYSKSLPDGAVGKLFVPCSDDGWTDTLSINDIPILYPCSSKEDVFFEDGSNVLFNHDLIKSIFFLLSAYQELDPNVSRDDLGRFSYKNSIQEHLNIAFKPVVNYYMEWMLKGIERWCTLNHISVKRVSVFKSPVIHLTHNVRRVNYFSTSNIINGWMQVLGLKPLDMPRKAKLKAVAYATKHALKLDVIENPWWTFERVCNLEQSFGFSSSWFFLTDSSNIEDRGDVNINSEDVRHAMLKIGSKGFDIAALLPNKCTSQEQIASASGSLHDGYSESLPYCRMNLHSLDTLDNLRNLELTNMMVDCSLHFADFNGFRNSYCLPFYPFDHEKQRIMGILEIPLTINASNFLKNNIEDETIFSIAEVILDEIRKFNGVCSMQWTNTDFELSRYPNSFKLYEDILRYASQYQTISATTTDVVRRIISIGNKLFE